jgi:nitrile hydratase accessory protein
MSAPLFTPDDPAAPPRANGELVFTAPWESRVFGLAAALRERGLFSWDEFRAALIAEIGAWEQRGAPAHTFSYDTCWQAALEQLLTRKGLCSPAELERRERELASHDVHERREGTS